MRECVGSALSVPQRDSTLMAGQVLEGEQLKGPKLVLTLMVLPDVVYFRQSLPSKQKVRSVHRIEKELESSSKVQLVFESAVRVAGSCEREALGRRLNARAFRRRAQMVRCRLGGRQGSTGRRHP